MIRGTSLLPLECLHANARLRRSPVGSVEMGKDLMFLTVDPMWDPLRQDPRFKSVFDRCDFMRTAGLERTAPGSSR